MRRESSEQVGMCATGTATVPTRSLGLLAGAFVILIVFTGACATWTGSVGAVLGKDNVDGRLFVREAPDGMGAAKAGVSVGDEVVAIDGKPVAKMTPAEVHEALAGKVGTKVKVTVMRGGASLDFVVERGPLAGT
jgi:C-terminal processing protease CtpA/Prc